MSNLPVIQIAIVDDHDVVRAGLISLINVLGGFNVCIEASDGNDLLDKISHASFLPDVCLIDVNMDGMDGFETMLQLNKRWPRINCIALTMYSSDEVILRMFKNGAKGYLSKKCTAETLKEAIIEVYSNEYYFSDLVLKKFPKMSMKNIKKYTKKALNEKQIEFLSLTCSDLTYEEIGERMSISARTAEKYCHKLRDELGIHSRVGLVMYALYVGIGKFDNGYK